MADALLYGDTVRSAELRHEVPVPIVDPFVYVERGGRRVAVVTPMEIARIHETTNGSLELMPFDRFGWDDIVRTAANTDAAHLELVSRVCSELEVREARVPGSFPLGVAEWLREHGVTLVVDQDEFERRRRVKSDAELAGIGAATAAAGAAYAALAELVRAAEEGAGGLVVDGEPLTCELLRRQAEEAIAEHGSTGEELIIASHGAQTADGHEPGSGQIQPREAIMLDIFPRDRASGCYSDNTRTWCWGEPPAELVSYHALCLEALREVREAIRPGVSGRDLHRIACDVFAEAGQPTQLSKQPGETLLAGFYHSLGHGVGLEVHEAPWLGRSGTDLVAGDVIAVEPGCYRPGFGGVRIEDLLLVTEDGCETLTQVPYDLAP
jgi:Xaa-Pro aminopeptidase